MSTTTAAQDTPTRLVYLGVATGFRSITPLAGLCWAQQFGAGTIPENGPFSILRRREVAVAVAVLALGEIAADLTLPLPARTHPAPLAMRMAIGGLIGAVLFSNEDRPAVLGTAVGALAAGVGAFAGFGGRMLLRQARIPDYLAALLGDAETVNLTISGVKRNAGVLA